MTKKIDQRLEIAPVRFTRGQRWLLLAVFVALIVFRIPSAWIHGRFLDEEATVFLAYAWHHPSLDALFRPFAGYWNMAASATTWLVARLVKGGLLPLERAPYVTMLIALTVQILPALLILAGRIRGLESRAAIIVALLILSIAPGIEEVFFNVLHIQFHLALCAALILASDLPTRAATRIGTDLLLFFTPLCGPGSLAFLPLFGLRALVDRSRGRLEQMLAFGAGGAVQMLIFYGSSPLRGSSVDPGTVIAAMFVRLIVMPTLGFGKANVVGDAIYQAQLTSGMALWWSVMATVVIFGGLLVLALRRRDAAIWFLLSSITIAVASFGFGMIMIVRNAPYDINSERYTFLPLALLCFALIVMALRTGAKERPIYALFLLLTLITGVSRYPRPLARLTHGPSWPAEVAAWGADHNHPLMVWPKPWQADLSDLDRPCSPVGAKPAGSSEPRYCENGWASGFFRPQEHRDDAIGEATPMK